MTKLLGISGSLRAGSFNTMLVKEAARVYAPGEFRMADIRLPLFDEDLEVQGIPPEVEKLVEDVRWAEAIVISTPEYNKGPSGALKNALDWISRLRPAPMAGTPVAVVSAAAGVAGGQRAKSLMYLLLVPFKCELVFNPEVNLGAARDKFDANGRLTDEAAEKFLGQLMDALKAKV